MTIDDLLEKLTLEEKIALCSGDDFWQCNKDQKFGLPKLLMCDGPHGLRKQHLDNTDMLGINNSYPSTCFPTASNSANSWNEDLLEEMGEALGKEAALMDIDIILGPGANIKRNPLCGRNFEYFSEDPILSGKLAASLIRGIQKNGTNACLKHFACNNQELERFTSNSIIDERSLHEIYLKSFEIAVKEGKPNTIMSAYNQVNNTFCSDNKLLLDTILRKDWGFDGLVITDWGGLNNRMKAFEAGCDLSMPGGSAYMEDDCLQAVNDKKLSEDKINDSVSRLLKLMLAKANKQRLKEECLENNYQVALKVAQEGAVLLKNDGILPLKENDKIAIVGHFAQNPRYQGAGSSHINAYKLLTSLEVFDKALYSAGCDEKGETTTELLNDVTNTAQKVNKVIVFAGLPVNYESEGFDRFNLKMPKGHLKMIEAATKANPNVVVVLCCGSVVECDFADQVKGILYMGLAGEAMAEASKNLLYGQVNPSGKLAESWVYQYRDCISNPYYGSKDAQYRESLYVGYRYYDKANIPVHWPFGYGLSYSNFTYSNISINKNQVVITVKNTSDIAGQEVVQLYVHPNSNNCFLEKRRLKAFKKIYLEPHESKKVYFPIEDNWFEMYHNHHFIKLQGEYQIKIADQQIVYVTNGEEVDLHTNDWYSDLIGPISLSQWEKGLNIHYQENTIKKGSFTMNNSVMEMKDYSLVMKIMYYATKMVIDKGFKKEDRTFANGEYRMLMNASVGGPLRCMQISGGIKGHLFEGLLEMANGHYFKGLLTMIKK